MAEWRPEMVTPTESLWALVSRYVALRRMTVAALKRLDLGRMSTLYRSFIESAEQTQRIRSTLGVSARIASMSRIPIFPFATPKEALRYCPRCAAQGFHSSVFQIDGLNVCPLHGTSLRLGCPKCGDPLVGTELFGRKGPTDWTGRCRVCSQSPFDPLAIRAFPLAPSEVARFVAEFDAYATAQGRVVAAWRLRSLSHLEFTNANAQILADSTHNTRLCLNGINCPSLHVRAFYRAEGKNPPAQAPFHRTPSFCEGSSDRVRQRWAIRQWNALNTVNTHPVLVASFKAFMRHLSHDVPALHTTVLRSAKRDWVYPELKLTSYAAEACARVVTWFFLWRTLWSGSRLSSPEGRRVYEFYGEPGQLRKVRQFHPIPILEFSGLYERHTSPGHDATSWAWAESHAFASYLISLRDEAQMHWNAHRYMGVTYPYRGSPIKQRIAPAFIYVTRDSTAQRFQLTAWRDCWAEDSLAHDCQTDIVSELQHRKSLVEAINKLRPKRY